MTGFAVLSFYFLATSRYVLGDCEDRCEERTNLLSVLYESLLCTPEFESDETCCPFSFNCSHIEEKSELNLKLCYFNNKTYDEEESIENEEEKILFANCGAHCFCKEETDGSMAFQCAEFRCPEWLNYTADPGCHLKFALQTCCSVGVACPPFFASCKIGRGTYHEGQKFHPPKDKCTNCVCRQGFTGRYTEPFCKRKICVDEIKFQREVYSFCAPVYWERYNCCPKSWICPRGSDNVISTVSKRKASGPKCKFGNTTLTIGDKLHRSEKTEIFCECSMPPYLTCIENYKLNRKLFMFVKSASASSYCLQQLIQLAFLINVNKII